MSATVNGEELYFESSDAALSCSAELFATALLPVAVLRRARLRIDRGPDRQWRREVARALEVWARWWDTEPDLDRVLFAPPPPRFGAPWPRPRRVGLCFSLGVDSFHTLLRSGRRIDALILGEGLDMPLGDSDRLAAARSSLVRVARATGTRPLVVRTNLRAHPALRPHFWQRAHGGTLAALGHACLRVVGEVLISATKPHVADAPWGSHWETDPCYSSSRLRVMHVGADRRRNEKLEAILDEPLVQEHLRVCWENRSRSGNCGECEKCVRTMLIVSVSDGPGALPAFPSIGSLAGRVDAVERINHHSAPVYREVLDRRPPDDVAAAIERLLARSGLPIDGGRGAASASTTPGAGPSAGR